MKWTDARKYSESAHDHHNPLPRTRDGTSYGLNHAIPAGPESIIQLQRIAGNRGATSAIERARQDRDLQRSPVLIPVQLEGSKESKLDVPSPISPFEHPAVTVEIDKLAIEALRPLVADHANKAYGDFIEAIRKVYKELEDEKKASKEQREFVINVALTVALLPVGGVLTATAAKVGGAIAGPALQAKLSSEISSRAPFLLKMAGVQDGELVKFMTNDLYKKASSDHLVDLAKRFSQEKATSAVEGAAGKLKKIATDLAVSTDRFDCGFAYLDALEKAASSGQNNVIDAIHTQSTYSQLAGFYHAYQSVTIEFYRVQIGQQVDNFMSQIGPVIADMAAVKQGRAGTGNSLVRLDAYGQPRIAFVRYLPSSATYAFKSWVTPDMEAMALAIDPNPRTISTSAIVGQIPDPMRSAAKERIVKMNAWGRIRIAAVGISDEGGWVSSREHGVMTFNRWITDDEKLAMEAKGEQQIGGINEVSPSSVRGIKPPPDA